MTKRLSLNSVISKLLELDISILSVGEFSKIFNVSSGTARGFLFRNTRKENSPFLKIKGGVYVFSLNNPIKFEIANKLYKPSYISFETALSFYDIIPETIYTITSATTKPSKEFDFKGIAYKYYAIKEKLFFGYIPRKINNKIILIAEKEKALLDYLYFLSLKNKPFNERLDLKKIDKIRLGYYVNYFNKNIKKNKSLISLVNKVYKSL